MGALDPAKLLVILVIALVVLGPERLPKVAREAGAIWRQLSKMREQVVSEIKDALPDDLPTRADLPYLPRPNPGAISGFVTGLMTPNSTTSPTETTDGDPVVADGEPPVATASTFRDVSRLHAGLGQREFGSQVIIHPELGDFAFPPDDPNMN